MKKPPPRGARLVTKGNEKPTSSAKSTALDEAIANSMDAAEAAEPEPGSGLRDSAARTAQAPAMPSRGASLAPPNPVEHVQPNRPSLASVLQGTGWTPPTANPAEAQVLRRAQAAILHGADVEQVKHQLRAAGINPELLT